MNVQLYAIIGLLVALMASGGYGLLERQARIAAVQRADVAEATTKSVRNGLNELQKEMRAAAARLATSQRVRQDVASTPDSRACASSPPVRAALDGLFGRDRAAGNPGSPDRASGAARPAR